MNWTKLILSMLVSISGLLFWSGVIGGVIGYLTSNYYLGTGAFIATFLVIYIKLFVPMSYVVKMHIDELVDANIVIDTTISPYSDDISFLRIDDELWFSGEGLFDMIKDLYRTQKNANGLYIMSVNMPYLPVYFLPWDSILQINKDTNFMREHNAKNIDVTHEILLKNNEKILLPIDKEAYALWEKSKVS